MKSTLDINDVNLYRPRPLAAQRGCFSGPAGTKMGNRLLQSLQDTGKLWGDHKRLKEPGCGFRARTAKKIYHANTAVVNDLRSFILSTLKATEDKREYWLQNIGWDFYHVVAAKDSTGAYLAWAIPFDAHPHWPGSFPHQIDAVQSAVIRAYLQYASPETYGLAYSINHEGLYSMDMFFRVMPIHLAFRIDPEHALLLKLQQFANDGVDHAANI